MRNLVTRAVLAGAALAALAYAVVAQVPTGTNTVGQLKVPLSTVAGLPTCNAGNEGLRWGVTDANGPTSLSAVIGAGGVHVSVYCNNTNWIVQ